MQGHLVQFPLPMLTFLLSAVAAALMLRADLGQRAASILFAAFFAVLSVSALMVGLRFGYGIDRLVPLQRALPLFAGPLIWLGFVCFALPPDQVKKRAMLHLGVAVGLLILAPLALRDLVDLDLIVALSYLVYAGLLLRLWSQGDNGVPHARIGSAAGLRLWMLAGAGLLIVFALADAAIAVSFAYERRGDAMMLISVGALVMVAALTAVIVAIAKGDRRARAIPVVATDSDAEADALESRARALLLETQLYLDTDLTVDRLARRLQVPSRALSVAINQTSAMNVSQYVNDFRLDHAAGLLAKGEDSVVQVLEKSGFLTRSNFYREFQRRFDMTPAAYRQSHGK